MNRDGLQTDAEHPTGSVQVSIENGEPHYRILADCAYDFIAGEPFRKKMAGEILYHGSLALRNPVSRAALRALKNGHRGLIFVDVNLRPPWWDMNLLPSLLGGAHCVKMNDAELAALCPGHPDLETAMRALAAQYSLGTLIVTRGALGAIAYDKQGQFTSVSPSGATEVVDTVGAGDAFASVVLLGLLKHWPLQATLKRAQEFAGAFVGLRGATVGNMAFYQSFTQRWKDLQRRQ